MNIIAIPKTNTTSLLPNSRLLNQMTSTLGKHSVAGVCSVTAATALASLVASLINSKTDKNIIEKLKEIKISDNFPEYKNELIKFLRTNNYDKAFIEDVDYRESIEELDLECSYLISRLAHSEDLWYDEELNLIGRIENGNYSDEIDKIIYENGIAASDKLIPLVKLISNEDTNPEIVKIKKEIKQNYVVKDLYFNNNINLAKNVQKALEILEKNNINYNGSILASELLNFGGIQLDSTDGVCILINNEYDETYMFDDLHLILHEMLHSIQPNSLEFRTRKIPNEYLEVANNVSEYAKDNYALEVHCELYVKKLLEGLSDKEQELFDYLGGSFLDK